MSATWGPSTGLAWRLARAGGRRGAAGSVLAAASLAVTTAVLVLAVGSWSGFQERADRTQWRSPRAVAAQSGGAVATAVQRTTTSAVDGRELVVVDVAATGSGDPPLPPGLEMFPGPGEVHLAPALADLVREHPEAPVAQRFAALAGGRVTGELGEAALAHPDELVAVVGHDPGDAAVTAPVWEDLRRPDAYAGPAPIADFAGSPVAGGQAAAHVALATVALVLLVVPLLVLAGAAARLGLARRDARLAALRLVGGTPAQVLLVTTVESGVTAVVGAVAGAAGALLVVPLAAAVPVAGGRWYAADLVPPAPVLLAAVAGVVALAVGSAVVALRRVVADPLGVAGAHTPRRPSAVRAVVFAALLLGFLRFAESDGAALATLVVVFAGVFGALAVVGPWAVALLGRLVVSSASTAAGLLAGRRMLDDPRGAWRVVGAVAMTGFVAGALVLLPTGSSAPPWGAADRLDVAVPAAAAVGVAADLREGLAAAGVDADVDGPGEDSGALVFLRAGDQVDLVFLSVTARDGGGGAGVEAVRAVVDRVAPGSVAATGGDVQIADDQLTADVRSASVIVLGTSFLVAAASAGTTSLAAVLDRRRTYRQLSMVGVPLRVLDRARALETQLPLVVLTVGSTVTGVVAAAPLTRLGLGSGGLDVTGVLLLLGCLLLGLLGVRVASAASRPLLARVAADPRSAAD